MTNKSNWWESDAVKAVEVIAAIITILSALGILQYFGALDFWTPISSFFELTVPMSFFVFVGLLFFFFIASIALFPDFFISKPFGGAELLRYGSVRYMAKLCREPQTPAFLKGQFAKFYEKHTSAKFTNSHSCLTAMEEKGLVQYNTEKAYWVTTQKSLDYLAKFYGYPNSKKQANFVDKLKRVIGWE
jgi:hypothetical protein